MKNILTAIFSLLMLATASVKADIVVLVHGYLGSPDSWETSGINTRLQAAGWNRAGVVFSTPAGIMMSKLPTPPKDHQVYSVSLPSRAPVGIQADLLKRMLSDLQKRHPMEEVVLVTHSAGGVVARMALVKYGAGKVSKLITIASPHLGTGLAAYALNETHQSGPVGVLKSFFGGNVYHTAKSSTGLFVDLVPSRPGNMLYWLNSRQHPAIEYISIARGKDININGDQIVPGYSQDMNRIPALHGKSQLYYVNSNHMLNPRDGELLALLLESNL